MVRGKGLMNIRKMTFADSEGAAALESTVLDGWSEAGIRGSLEADFSRCFVAEKDGDIVAFCSFSLVCGDANLDALSVSEAVRRQGIGRKLLIFALHEIYKENTRSVFLEVRSQNAPAIALYTSLGFKAAGMRRNFYEKPCDDAIIMKLEMQ